MCCSLIKNSLIVFVLCGTLIGAQERSERVKRKLVFNKSMRFFARINGKDNIVKGTTFFTHGWGFRVNWEVPDSLPRRHKFFKRDIHSEIDNVPTRWGQQGFSCLIKYLCEITARVRSSEKCGILCEIGNIIKQSSGFDASFIKSLTSNCEKYQQSCPYAFEYMQPAIDL